MRKSVAKRYFMMYITGRMPAHTAIRYIEGYEHILNMHRTEGETDEAFYKREPEIRKKIFDCKVQIKEIKKREAGTFGEAKSVMHDTNIESH